MWFTDKAKIVDRGYKSCALESTGCMNLIFSPQCVPRQIYPFLEKFSRSGKGSITEKAKIVDRCSICSVPEGTGSKASI